MHMRSEALFKNGSRALLTSETNMLRITNVNYMQTL